LVKGAHGSLVISNAHVTWGADHVAIELTDGKVFPVTVVGLDAAVDLVVLRTSAGDEAPAMSFAADVPMRVGEPVLSMSSLPGLSGAASAGIFSGRGKVADATLAGERNVDYLFTDAVMSAGTSGGPLLDARGDVVGINVAVVGTGRGLGIAIPSHLAQAVIQGIEEKGRFDHGAAGLQVTDDAGGTAGAHELSGVHVTGLSPGGAAEISGVHVGDWLLAIDGGAVHGASEVLWRAFMAGPGTSWKVELALADQHLSVDLVLQALSTNAPSTPR